MLRLHVFVICRKRFINKCGGLYLSLGTLYEDKIWKIPSSDNNRQNLFVWLWLSDTVACSTSLYIWSSSRAEYEGYLAEPGSRV